MKISLMLIEEIRVTIIAVEGPNNIKDEREIPKFTETKPVFGSGTEKLSAANIKIPKSTAPKTEIFLNLKIR
ncbi:MAG: hypothetical protein NTV16_08260 [Actinobacteria bacterium]|nr:hypothetical protein [Actinomycetota bacterium]